MLTMCGEGVGRYSCAVAQARGSALARTRRCVYHIGMEVDSVVYTPRKELSLSVGAWAHGSTLAHTLGCIHQCVSVFRILIDDHMSHRRSEAREQVRMLLEYHHLDLS